MIKLGSRFAEYGLTGGFFIFAQILLLAWVFPEGIWEQFDSIATPLDAGLKTLPQSVHTAFSGLLVSLTIIGIFFTGFLLDLMGSLLLFGEGRIFKNQITETAEWFPNFLKSFGKQSQVDYEQIQSVILTQREEMIRGFKGLRLWSRDGRRAYIEGVKRNWRVWGALRSFRRLENHMMAFVLAAASAANSDWLADNLRLVRVSRAISASLIILGLESFQWAVFEPESRGEFPNLTLLYVFMGLSIFITYRAYKRFCMTLFTLTYAYHTRPKVES